MTGEQPDMDITVTVNSEDGGTQVYDTTASALAAEQRELGNTGLADPRHIIGEIILGGGFGGFHWRRIGGEENWSIRARDGKRSPDLRERIAAVTGFWRKPDG